MSYCRFSRKAPPRTSTTFLLASEGGIARTCGPIPVPPLLDQTPKGLQDHPTVKPTAMLQDALIDLTNRGEIVLDPFLGSGSTLIAAENTGRGCCGIELDPLYVDVIIRRYQAETGAAVILADSGETFEKVAARRPNGESDERH